MITFLVAEDESLLRRSIIQMIENTHHEFKAVGEAGDGEIALDLVRELKPDVVFTDIKMPIMDGLTLISEIKNSNIQTVPIILSGYNEFEYAKKAIKLGVMDYLLKPLTQESLESLLEDLVVRIKSTKKEKITSIFKKVLIENDKSFLDNKSIMLSELHEYKEYSFILLCSGSYRPFPSNGLTTSIEFWIKVNLESIADKFILKNFSFWIFDGEFKNEKVIMVAAKGDLNKNIQTMCRNIHNEVISLGMPVTTVCGGVTGNITELENLFQHSKVDLNKKIIFGKPQIIFNCIEAKPCERSNPDCSNIKKVLSKYIRAGQNSLYKNELKKLIDIFEDGSYPQLLLERQLKQLFIDFIDDAGTIPQDMILQIELEINELISNTTNYKSLYEGLCIISDELFEACRNSSETEYSHQLLVKKVEQYIKQNYITNITLQSLSEKFNLVPSYLSYLYKKYNGISPSDYITKLRIENAMELLTSHSTMFLKDIAKTVGYEDPFYFSRVFKSVTGKSPTEYKNSR